MADASGVILDADEAVCDFLQRSKRELAGASYVQFTHPADRLRNAMQIDQLRPSEYPATIRKRYVLPGGGVVWADVAISRLDAGSDAGRLLGTLSRVAENHAAPAQLWRTALDLARFDDMRREFMGDLLFGERSWAIVIHMYLAEAEGRSIDVAGLAVAAGLPALSISRWLTVLEAHDLVEPGLGGGGRQLTARGIAKLEKVLMDYRAERRPDAAPERLPGARV